VRTIGCPVGPEHRLPPRRTHRWRGGGPPSLHRPYGTPTWKEVHRLIRPNRSPYETRCAAFVSLTIWSGIRHAKDILALAHRDLNSLRMPKEAWKPVAELIKARYRRGVLSEPRLFCTFRHGLGHPVHRRDFERRLVRFQWNRGIYPPYTFTGLRQSTCLEDAIRIPMQEYMNLTAG
jgi:hypothetical protein